MDLAMLLLLSAIWGASYLFIRIAAPALGPLPLVELRVVLAAAALALWITVGLRDRVRLARWRQFLILGTLNNVIPFGTIATAELVLSASLGAILGATSPIFTVLVRSIWERRRPSGAQLAGTLIGCAGVAVLVGVGPLDPTGPALGAVGLMLVGSLGYAVAAVYAARTFRGERPVDVALGQLAGASALLLLPALATRVEGPVPPEALVSAVALSLLGTAVAYLIYFRLIARVGPTRAITVTLLIPAFGVLFGHLFLGEPVEAGLLIGVALILAGVALVTGLLPRDRARPA